MGWRDHEGLEVVCWCCWEELMQANLEKPRQYATQGRQIHPSECCSPVLLHNMVCSSPTGTRERGALNSSFARPIDQPFIRQCTEVYYVMMNEDAKKCFAEKRTSRNHVESGRYTRAFNRFRRANDGHRSLPKAPL